MTSGRDARPGRFAAALATDDKNGTAVPPKNAYAVLAHPATGAEVHLLGTCHVLMRAADATRELILRVKPDVVVVELDER